MAGDTPGRYILNEAYSTLGYQGQAIDPRSSTPGGHDRERWLELGEWLILTERMGADRVFFVGDQPVIIFQELPRGAGAREIIQAYRSAWSLSRPQCLFLATDDALHVYSLSAPPVRSPSELDELEPLHVLQDAADVAEVLATFHRERIESGATLDDSGLTGKTGHADRKLIRDVRNVTELLTESSLPPAIAHTLVERALLVRYLEDRGVITRAYFEAIADEQTEWHQLLDRDPEVPQLGPSSYFANSLGSKAFTFAVFEKLSADFNGDLFVPLEDEYHVVEASHLELLRRALTGEGLGMQRQLFLWAYDFSVVPTSLISAMYEQFYRADAADDVGTHYTSPELVEYVLSSTLTPERLDDRPRVVDPACGSGVFLVESFRRIVRHEMAQMGSQVPAGRLRELLLSRVAGVDTNREAVRLAAFSLYLTYLNYQNPQDIRTAGPLPPLINYVGDERGTDQPDVLVVGDAFSPLAGSPEHRDSEEALPWVEGSFDVVVGNPPWGRRDANSAEGERWARAHGLPYANRDPAQLFLWRSLSFLRVGGVASLLVGATALFNSRGHSFRTAWLAEVELLRAVDFSASRDIFFAEAIAPFFLLQYGHATNGGIQHVRWETVLPTRALRTTEAVVFGNIDQKWVPKEHLVARDYLWKTYSWGNHRDAALLARLDLEKSFSDVIPQDPGPHYGFQRGERRPSEELLSMRVLADMEIFGGLQEDWFEESPSGVKREPDSRIYQGQRIVMKRGAQSGFGPVARLETEPFAFRHTFYCFPLSGVPKWQAKLMLGILLSRLGRYRLFLTSGSWGVWHDSFVPRDILALPIRMRGSNDKVTRRIIRAVDALPDSVSESTQFEPRFEDSDGLDVETVLQRLDAAVLDLFELSPAERDLVNDFHQYTLEYNQKKAKSEALAPAILPAVDSGTYETALRLGDSSLAAYLSSFLDVWNRELAPDGEFTWALVPGPQSGMLAVVFETQVRAATGRPVGGSKGAEWEDVIERLGDSLSSPLSTHIRRNGVLRAISDTSISIVKRNERRLWTASSARQDAEATMLGLMSGAGA